MRSQRDIRLRAVMVAALTIAGVRVGAAHLQEATGQARAESPGPPEIVRAIETVKADPNLAAERTVKTLQWRNQTEAKPSAAPSWLAWIAGLFGWLEQSARVLVWCVAVLLAALAAVFVVRVSRRPVGSLSEESFVAPTHVRDLDIRPETLPDDVGSAARALWDRGERRASLALLYRGMLSRLAHVHRIAIRDSSTEGDCVALAANHLTQPRHQYASRLVATWQRAVYGREDVQAAAVYALCDGFASALDAASARDSSAERMR